MDHTGFMTITFCGELKPTDLGIPDNSAKGDLFVMELVDRSPDAIKFQLKRVHINTDIDLDSLEK